MLIATGIMAIGLVMVATIFPVGVKLTSLATERTIGAVVADEAFAKVRLYGLRDPNLWLGGANACSNFHFVSGYDLNGNGSVDSSDNLTCDWSEFRYPSVSVTNTDEYGYHWSALCRRVSQKDVQVTVFINRRTTAGKFYQQRADGSIPLPPEAQWPQPISVSVLYNPAVPRDLVIQDEARLGVNESRAFFGAGYTIVDDYSGRIYKILEVRRDTDTLVLEKKEGWQPNPRLPGESEVVWVVPPAVGSDRYPCVGVYQKVIHFNELN